MLLKADADLDFDIIGGVLDAGQAAGAQDIGLLTPGLQNSALKR
jgi:biopolymer transport protein ExbD